MDAIIQMNTVIYVQAFWLLTIGAEQAPPWPENKKKKREKNQ